MVVDHEPAMLRFEFLQLNDRLFENVSKCVEADAVLCIDIGTAGQ